MAEKEKVLLPPMVFFAYLLAALAAICAYRYFFPVEPEPLKFFTLRWRLVLGLLNFIELYPALAFAALVIPFGLKEHSEGGYAGAVFVGNKGFSASFLQYITWPVITASLAAALYGVLWFIVLPLGLNGKTAMEDRAKLYEQARAGAASHAAAKEWPEASQLINIAEAIWPGNPEVEKLKTGVSESLAFYHQAVEEKRGAVPDPADLPPVSGGQPVNSADAMRLAEEAFARERFYDAHWLAILAQRLARRGSAEIPAAEALASRAWDKISSLEPNSGEEERYSLYRLKRNGYEAMIANDWIAAYYIFRELSEKTPQDPDVDRYLSASKTGVANIAFFVDELNLAVGNIVSGPVFSLPAENGRMALRFSSLILFDDYAYGWNPEITAVDGNGRLLYRVSAEYAKLLPVSAANAESTALLFRALDRIDKSRKWDPVWTGPDGTPESAAREDAGGVQLTLPVSYDLFILLSRLKGGAGSLNFQELFTAEKNLAEYGYVPQVFRAEIIRRLGEPVFFLPLAMMVLIVGWRFRARRKPRYVYVPMLGALPLVFYGFVLFYRMILNNAAVWFSLSLGFHTAMICFVAGQAVLFLVTLVLLAAQHG